MNDTTASALDASLGTHAFGAAPTPSGGVVRPRVLGAISFSHFLNDMIQSMILALYPMLKGNFHLNFAKIGLITLTYQATASLLQPLVGMYTDRRPKPYSLAVGMSFTLTGLVLLAFAPTYAVLLVAAGLVGTGSSVFHPESSRVARMASGGRHGFAQAVFQVGGNTGSAVGPLLAALVVIPHGQRSLAWFSLAALAAIVVLSAVGGWYKREQTRRAARGPARHAVSPVSRKRALAALAVLMGLVFAKYFYLTSLSSYYTFYLIERFGVSVRSAQIHLFVFLFAVALGTLLGGPIGDRIGRKRVIWFSILGVAPFSLALPHVSLAWTGPLTFIIGFILASAFSAILVFAQELAPRRTGAVSGLFFGFAFGIGGIGAAVLGWAADLRGIEFVYEICAWLPLLGLLAALLPDVRTRRA